MTKLREWLTWARSSLEKYASERPRAEPGFQTLNTTLNWKLAAQNDDLPPQPQGHLAISLTPTATWCHSHSPAELCGKGLCHEALTFTTFRKAQLNQIWEELGVSWWQLPALHLPAWTPSPLLQEQDALVLFRFQVLCPEANPERGLVLVVLGIEPGMKGQIPLLAWAGNVDWGLHSTAFLPALHRDFFFFFLLWILQFMRWPSTFSSPREKFAWTNL